MKPAETTPRELQAKTAGQTPNWIRNLRALYRGDTRRAHRFQYGLIAFDSLTVVFIVFTSFLPRTDVLEAFDVLFGLVILADVAARITISRRRWKEVLHPITLVDFLVVVSFLAPITGQGLGFLRILRTLRLLRSYRLLSMVRKESETFRLYEEVITAAVNLFVFTFVMTAIVYQTQHWTNPNIENYADALYFTVTALTTTGFGDITLPGTKGRLITVVIMICGVTLFLRLAQVLFKPNKVRFACPTCGLQRHDSDAVHCKACGQVLNIPDEGLT